jgi:hypothetical protein
MKPVFQTITRGTRANCWPACIASILELDLDDIPYVPLSVSQEGGEWWICTKHVLEEIGIDIQPTFRISADNYYIKLISFNSKEFGKIVSHAVVSKGEKIIHDPSSSDADIMNILKEQYVDIFYIEVFKKEQSE